MHKWKVFSGILLIFSLGVLVGVAGTGLFFKNRIQRFMDPQAPPPPNQILFRELESLDLSDDQWPEINKLMEEMNQEISRRMKNSAPQFKQVFDQYVLKIGEILNPQQKKELTTSLKRIEQRMKHMAPPPPFREKDGMPPPPPGRDRSGSLSGSGPHPEMRPPFSPSKIDHPPHPGEIREDVEQKKGGRD